MTNQSEHQLPPYTSLRPCFTQAMLDEFIRSSSKRRLFGGLSIEASSAFSAWSVIFEMSGHLGSAFSALPDEFLIAFCAPAAGAVVGHERTAMLSAISAMLDNDPLERLSFRAEQGATIEQACVLDCLEGGVTLDDERRILSSGFAGKQWLEFLGREAKRKLPTKWAWEVGEVQAMKAMGLAARHPRSFQLMAEKTWVERRNFSLLVTALGGTDFGSVKNADEFASTVLESFRRFCGKYWPELTDALFRVDLPGASAS